MSVPATRPTPPMSLRSDVPAVATASDRPAASPPERTPPWERRGERHREQDSGRQGGRRWSGRPLALLISAMLIPAALFSLPGCDYFAEKKLVAGVHTEADVRNFMGKPEMIREEPDGTRRLEYPRSPMGSQTYFVYIGKDGKYKGMEKAMNEANFRRVTPGMSKDDVRGILGKQTEILPLKLKNVEVWSWRYEGDGNTTMLFNVTFDDATGKATDISRERDPKVHGGA